MEEEEKTIIIIMGKISRFCLAFCGNCSSLVFFSLIWELLIFYIALISGNFLCNFVVYVFEGVCCLFYLI